MSHGIEIIECKNATITNCTVEGYEVGLYVKDSDVALRDSTFNNVSTAVKGVGTTNIDAQSVTHNELHWGADTTPLDIIREFANANV